MRLEFFKRSVEKLSSRIDPESEAIRDLGLIPIYFLTSDEEQMAFYDRLTYTLFFYFI